jgi:excisionase family DNA binding protein
VLTVSQVAELVQVSERTVARAIQAGQLVASQLHQGRGGWRIYESAVANWMSLRSEPREPAPPPAARRVQPHATRDPRTTHRNQNGRLTP